MKIASFILMVICITSMIYGLLADNAIMIGGAFASGLIACLWEHVRTH